MSLDGSKELSKEFADGMGLVAIEFDRTRSDLEAQLRSEQDYSRRLREYVSLMITRVQQLERHNHIQALRLSEAKSALQEAANQANDQRAGFSPERLELERYRKAWAEVLDRDRLARQVLADHTQSQVKIEKLEKALAAETQALEAQKAQREGVQKELQSALALSQELKRELENEAARRKQEERERALSLEEMQERARINEYALRRELEAKLKSERARWERGVQLEQEEHVRALAAHHQEIRERAEAFAAMERTRKRIEEELSAVKADRDIKVSELEERYARLRDEWAMVYELLGEERKRIRDLGEELLREWDSGDSSLREVLDRKWIESLLRSSDIPSIVAEVSEINPVARVPFRPKLNS